MNRTTFKSGWINSVLRFLTAWVLFSSYDEVQAQQQDHLPPEMATIARPVSSPGWIEFRNELRLDPLTLCRLDRVFPFFIRSGKPGSFKKKNPRFKFFEEGAFCGGSEDKEPASLPGQISE